MCGQFHTIHPFCLHTRLRVVSSLDSLCGRYAFATVVLRKTDEVGRLAIS